MPLRRAIPLRHRPSTLCDAMDGSNGPPGGMQQLVNLVPSLTTKDVWQPRPPAVQYTDFPGFVNPGFVSALLIIGNLAYGLIASDRNAGFDEPFVYDLTNKAFLTVNGINAANVPASPPTTGDWTPPIMAQVGTRIIVTHPGFAGGDTGYYFGWFDVSYFSQTIVANETAGSPILTGNFSIFGMQPGLFVIGFGIPPATSIKSLANFVLDTTGDLHTTSVIENIANPSGLEGGMDVSGAGISAGTKVVALLSGGTSVSIDKPATTAGTGVALTFAYSNTTTGDTTAASFTIQHVANIRGLEPGMTVTSADVPVGTIILSVDTPANEVSIDQAMTGTTPHGAVTFAYTNVTTGDLFAGTQITNLASTTGVAVGQAVAGAGIPLTATVLSVDSATRVTISPAATVQATGVAITFSGATITLSANATATSVGELFDVAGGSTVLPLWGAGNTNLNPLVEVPTSVAQMAGCAHYAVPAPKKTPTTPPAVVISDPLLPVQVTNANQVLTMGNGLSISALGPLPLNSLLGGIVQAIIVFQGVSAMQQITGNPATLNLALNQLPVPTGTFSGLSVVPTMKGLAFISPEGLRIVDFSCNVGDPIGVAGSGVTAPFTNAINPSRVCAAATSDALRISVHNGTAYGDPVEEFWFDLGRHVWSGPHTFPASVIQPWGRTFIMAPNGITGALWQSDALPNLVLDYVENEKQMTFAYQTFLLPDNEQMAENAMVETAVMMGMEVGQIATVQCINDVSEVLDTVMIPGYGGFAATWGAPTSIWGVSVWGAVGAPLFQRPVPWHRNVTFKQMSIRITGNCTPGVQFGNLYLRYQIAGYLLQPPSAPSVLPRKVATWGDPASIWGVSVWDTP